MSSKHVKMILPVNALVCGQSLERTRKSIRAAHIISAVAIAAQKEQWSSTG